VRQVAGALVFTALLLGGIQLYLGGEAQFGLALLALSGVSLVWILVTARRGAR
jgi:hypothetical protein